MELNQFLKYKDIVIQCHDNPDADALASGYALMWYFHKKNKPARFIYRGRNEIKKSNLIIMIKELEVPVEYEPFFAEEPDLIITVDCCTFVVQGGKARFVAIASCDRLFKKGNLIAPLPVTYCNK